MAFNTKCSNVNYTVMVTKVANGYVLNLLDDDSEIVHTTIATAYNPRDYASYSLCSALEELWDYAEKLAKQGLPVETSTPITDTTMADVVKQSLASNLAA